MGVTLSSHQKRVLAALLKLEQTHGWRWWSRDAIGRVVQADGYHQVIQRKTMTVLKRAGYVRTERSAWAPAMQRLVRCTCACCMWGLTASGARLAKTLRVAWSEASEKLIADARLEHGQRFEDEDDAMQAFRDWASGLEGDGEDS